MKLYKAFLFDLNGTMIDDMNYHVRAWHKILNDFGAGISMEEMRVQCYGKNHELLERMLPGRFTEQEKIELSVSKETRYQEEFRPFLKLIDGLDEFLEVAYEHKIKMAIGSAAIRMNIDFVLDGLDLRKYFSAIVCADDVAHSKPHPETYLKCAEKLNMDAADCLVFEDSPTGTESALHAGMDCVVTNSMHAREKFNPINIIRFVKDYPDDLFEQIRDIKMKE